jgi:hypothetical protein
MPRDIPIIFSGPMVRALLDGRKTMTRRLAWRDARKCEEPGEGSRLKYQLDDNGVTGKITHHLRPSPWRNVQPGDRLWVRESFSGPYDYRVISPGMWCPGIPVWYWADGNPSDGDWTKNNPSIFMPRWASRLTLVITETKIERLQDISQDDATAEGWPVNPPPVFDDPEVNRDAARDWFSELWEGLHGVQSWQENPEVVALSFRVIRANIDAAEARVA